MLTVGLMLYFFMRFSGHYYVEGVGYATIQDVLASVQFPIYFLVLLFVAKLLATSLTLGSGASGGVFSPALFLGATGGGAYGVVLHGLFPALDSQRTSVCRRGDGRSRRWIDGGSDGCDS
jgi:CIC family chloride channel protein